MNTTKRKTRHRKLIIFLISILTIFVVGAALASGIGLAMIKSAPPLDVNQMLTLNQPSQLFNDKSQFIDTVATNEQRTVISYKDMPDNLKHAFVAIEDERFYKHNGIDLKRISGAIYIDIMSKIKRTNELQGGSTITQQLIKNTVLTNEVTITRKIQEMYLAMKLEKSLTKDQILEAYLNTIFLGGQAYGVEAASQQYFNKKAKDLTLIESAFLAGVNQSPSVFYPFSAKSKKDPSLYLNRTKTVLSKMCDNGYITKDQLTSAIKDIDGKKLVIKQPIASYNKMNYESFSLPAINQVKADLKTQYNYTDDQIDHLLVNGALKIYTTMDQTMQDNTQKILNSTNIVGVASKKNGIIQPQAAAVIMDYHTGEVKTMIGGRGDQPPRSYNRADSTNFLRPTGSSIKPLTVYGAAIDSKMATAATVIEDSPVPATTGAIYGSKASPYNPKNSPDMYYGYVTLREGIMHSINVVAVKLEDKIGLNTGITYGQKFGLTFDSDDKSSISAISLGQLHHGTTPLIMTAAYGVFGNGGNYTTPRLYTKVVDRTGKTILQTIPKTNRVLAPESAYIMYDLLKGPVSSSGTGPQANFGNMEVRGKTGTSEDMQNLWFCGLTPYYSGAVWIGNDDSTKVNGVYSSTAAALWSSIMSSAHGSLPSKTITKPASIVSASVCLDSGELITDLCSKDPRGSRVESEMFIQGTVPTETCDIHTAININKLTGKIATANTPAFLVESRVFIKRNYVPTVNLLDEPYAVPTLFDDTPALAPVITPPITPDPTPVPDPKPVTDPTPDNGGVNPKKQ